MADMEHMACSDLSEDVIVPGSRALCEDLCVRKDCQCMLTCILLDFSVQPNERLFMFKLSVFIILQIMKCHSEYLLYINGCYMGEVCGPVDRQTD